MTRNEFLEQLKDKYYVENILNHYISVSLEPETTVYVTLEEDSVPQIEKVVRNLDHYPEEYYINMTFEDALWVIKNILRD